MNETRQPAAEMRQTPIYVPMYDKKGRLSICTIFSLSRTKAKALAKRQDFPKPIMFASNCMRYRLDEVVRWMDDWRGRVVSE